MANAVTLKDKSGVECYPKSHVKQIVDSSGKTQETINSEMLALAEKSGGGNMILEWNTDVATTRKQVKTKDRKAGMQISYLDPDNGWINEQYIGTFTTDTEWVKDENWNLIIDEIAQKEALSQVPFPDTNTIKDFCICDEKGNMVFVVENGYPKSKNFDGEHIINSLPPSNVEIVKEDMTPNSYYNLSGGVGTIAPEAPTVYTTPNIWWSYRVEVKEGGKIFLKTKGGNNGRAYAVTDLGRNILAVADANADFLADGVTLAIEQDGYLYLNCTTEDAYNIFECLVINSESEIIRMQVEKNTTDINILKQSIYPRKILSISNSYGCDATSYIPRILSDLGVTDVEIGVAYIGGASLEKHVQGLNGEVNYTYYYTTGINWQSRTNTPLLDILSDKEWDCIVFQQGSANSGKYESYEPYLTTLMKHCMSLNGNIKFAFNMTQPYAEGYAGLSGYGSSQSQMYEAIKQAITTVHYNNGLIIIPTGVAIQIARDTELNEYGEYTTHQLSSDGTHLDDGIGRYIAGLTWIISLLGLNVWTAKFRPEYPLSYKIPDGPRKTFVTVTEEMAETAKICAYRALASIDKILLTTNIE